MQFQFGRFLMYFRQPKNIIDSLFLLSILFYYFIGYYFFSLFNIPKGLQYSTGFFIAFFVIGLVLPLIYFVTKRLSLFSRVLTMIVTLILATHIFLVSGFLFTPYFDFFLMNININKYCSLQSVLFNRDFTSPASYDFYLHACDDFNKYFHFIPVNFYQYATEHFSK